MKRLTAFILCIIFAVLLFSGCKQTAENPPAASTEPSTAPTENTSETIKPNSGPIITTRPTDPPPTTEPTEPPPTTETSVDLYPQYVQTALDYMNARRELLVNGNTTAFSEIAISGIVNDEVKHRGYLIDNNIAIPEVTYTADLVKIVDEHGAYVVLREIGTSAAIEVTHILLITTNEKDLPFVVSDNYMETHTGFASASYLPHEIAMKDLMN